MKSLKCVDLFCGIGGMRLAAEKFGFRNVFSSEIDKAAVQTYSANFNDYPVGDIFKVKSNDIPDFDLLMAGFPCQPFSFAGKMMGFDDSRGTLFFEVARIAKAKQPSAILLENVKGIVKHDNGKTIRVIENTLKSLGYSIYWTLLDAKDFGLPQRRERWYCVALRDSLFHFEFPYSEHPVVSLKSILEKIPDKSTQISDAWSKRIDRQIKSNHERVLHEDFNNKPGSTRSKYGVYSKLNSDGTMRFHLGDSRKSQIQEGFFCSSESISPTIIANRVPQLWDLKRRLTVRECARAQGFPDDFVFPCTASQSYKQIGNSVAIPVVEAIVENIYKHLQIEIPVKGEG